jgi:hypothetical protein
MKGATSTSIALTAILVAGGILRVVGLDFGLPFDMHPDEGFYRQAVQGFESRESLEPPMFAYGGLAFYPLYGATRVVEVETREQLTLLQRGLAAALGTLTLLLTFFLGRAVRSTGVGLASAAVLAVVTLHVRDSHFGVADVQLAFLVTCALLALVLAARSGRPLHFALAGALTGLATATKYMPALLAIPIAMAALAAAGRDRAGARRCIGAAALAMVAAFLLGAPYTVLAWDRFKEDLAWQWSRALSFSGVDDAPLRYGPLYHIENSFGLGLGWPLTALVVLGLANAFLWRRGAWILALSVLLYFAAASFGSFTFVRYVLPIVPAAIVLAVDAVFRIVEPSWSRKRAVLAAAVLVLAAAPTAWKSVELVRLMTRDTTLQQLRDWCARNIPDGTKCAATHPEYVVPIGNIGLVGWHPVALQRGVAEFLLVFEHAKPDFDDPHGHELVRDVAFESEPVARFLSRHGERPDYLDTDSYYPYPLRSLGRVERAGPDVTVYRRRPQAMIALRADHPVPTMEPSGLEVEERRGSSPALHWERCTDPAAAGLRVRIAPRGARGKAGTVFFLPAHTDELDTTGFPAGAYEAWITFVGLTGPGPEAGPLAFEVE